MHLKDGSPNQLLIHIQLEYATVLLQQLLVKSTCSQVVKLCLYCPVMFYTQSIN